MNKQIAKLTMAERQELCNQIDAAHARGIRLDARIVAEAKQSLVLHKPIVAKVVAEHEITESDIAKLSSKFNVRR